MQNLARRLFTLSVAVSVLLCAGACGLVGCVPVKQADVTGGRVYDNFGYDDWARYGLLQVGPSNVPKSVTVLEAESYAIAPNGTRYGIATEPHKYDLDNTDDRVPYVRDRVYLVRANGRRTKRLWGDGRWEFVFVLQTPYGRDARQFTVDMSTFIYKPLVHRPN
jgi:hypothetical protein